MRKFSKVVLLFFALVPYLFLSFHAQASPEAVTLTQFPHNLQLYPRDVTTNQATIPLKGQLSGTTASQLIARVYRNNVLVDTKTQSLTYQASVANFDLSVNISAELANYTLKLFTVSGGNETEIASATDVVAGDVYVVEGQSNAVALQYEGAANPTNQSNFIRTYGNTVLHVPTVQADLNWYVGNGDDGYTSGAIGQWPLRLARQIVDSYQIPVAIINGAQGGTKIDLFQRDNTNPLNLDTNYGRLLYRLQNAQLQNKIRAIFWYQGESDEADAVGHEAGFVTLYNSWKIDYPSAQKIYLYQVRDGCFGINLQLRDRQRLSADTYSDITIMSTNGLNGHRYDCHYNWLNGYEAIGNQAFPIIARDFYGAPTSPNLVPPNVAYAYYSGANRSEITIVTRRGDDQLVWEDGAWNGFVLEGATGYIGSGRVEGNKLILGVVGSADNATGISYKGQYLGSPWVLNARGLGLLAFYNIPIGSSSGQPTARIASNTTTGVAPLAVQLDGRGSSDPDGSLAFYNWEFGDGTTASGIAVNHVYATPGSYTARLTVIDNQGNQATATLAINVTEQPVSADCTNRGVLRELWSGVDGLAVVDLTSLPTYPNQPTSYDILNNFEGPTDSADSYGVRARAYIVPPVSGSYTFWIASDDNGELWLSTDETAARATRIATVPYWSPSRQFDWYPEQKSAPIQLVRGQRYYIEALVKEWGGGDNLAVAWQTPNAAREVIGNANLCAYQLIGNAPTAAVTANPTTGTAPLTVNFNAANSADTDGSIVSYQWEFGDGTRGTGITTTHLYLNPGVFQARLTVTDNSGRADSRIVTIMANAAVQACATHGLLLEQWNNLSGRKLSSLTGNSKYPNSPTTSGIISQFEIPVNNRDNYGVRLRGYLYPSVSGNYRFWIAADEVGELYLSRDRSAANAVKIASTSSWTPSRQWDWYASQKSAEIYLEVGKSYYIEALMKEQGGADNLSVAWQVAGGVRDLITEPYLCPYNLNGEAPTAAFVANVPADNQAPATVTFDASGSADVDGTIVSYQWEFGNGATATGMTPTYRYTTGGSYTIRLTVTDNKGNSTTATRPIVITDPSNSSCVTKGLVWEVWYDVNGRSIADLTTFADYPNSPSERRLLTNFESPVNVTEYYGARVRGYLVAPTTGNYRFLISSDDLSELYLSTDSSVENARKIASVPNWTPYDEWGWFPEQQSTYIYLEAGKSYYIEALHKEGFGGDFVRVAWEPPLSARSIIPNSALCPLFNISARSAVDVVPPAENATPLSLSQLAKTLSPELQTELVTILASDQPLRHTLLTLREEWDMLMAEDQLLPARFIDDVTLAYLDLRAVASPELSGWFDLVWGQLKIQDQVGQSARSAWDSAEATTLPTAVGYRATPYKTPLLITFLSVLFVMVLLTIWHLKRSL